jgi:hypothetical protein
LGSALDENKAQIREDRDVEKLEVENYDVLGMDRAEFNPGNMLSPVQK